MHPRISVNNVCFPGANFSTLSRYWRELCVSRVSFMSQDLLGDFSGARAALASGPYALETIVHPFHFGPLDEVTDHWRADRSTLSRLIQNVAELGGVSVYLVTGGRGKLSWEDAARLFCEGVAPCVAEANEAGVRLILENTMPMYVDTHLGLTLDETVEIAQMAGIGVLIDIYACWMQRELKTSLKRALPLCGLVQVSDYIYGDRSFPSRAVAGEGVIPLKQIITWLIEGGYGGAFDLELLGPRIDKIGHVEAARRAGAFVGEVLEACGAK